MTHYTSTSSNPFWLGRRPADYEGDMNYNTSEDDWPETTMIIDHKQKLWAKRYATLPWWRKILHSIFRIDQGAYVHD